MKPKYSVQKICKYCRSIRGTAISETQEPVEIICPSCWQKVKKDRGGVPYMVWKQIKRRGDDGEAV